MTMQAPPAISIVPRSLQAVLDRRPSPGRAHSFHVTVDVEVDALWTVTLVAARPQGINLLIKLLRFEIAHAPTAGTPATGAANTRRTLRYAETPPDAHYAEVWLGDGDRAVSAKVAVLG